MILVTGADGIVGRGVCESLLNSGVSIVATTHQVKAHTLPGSVNVDLTGDLRELEPFVDRLSAIVHLAAAVPHSTQYPDNEASADRTRCIDRNILSIQQVIGIPVIYASTCGLYDRLSPEYKSEDDETKLKVTSPYFSAKATGEALFMAESSSTVLRLAAPIGPGLKPQLVVRRFLAAACAGEPITIWGSGCREQDFIDTRDIAELIIKILEKPKNIIMNVASGRPTTMVQLAEKVISAVGSGVIERAKYEDPRDRETARYSISRAIDHYGWAPLCSLEKSLIRLIES